MRELLLYFINRVRRDELFLEAAALSYTSILALIPALTVVVSIFTMVPAFEPLREQLLNFASENFMPVFTEAISENIGRFVSHAGSMTIAGTIMLIVVSLMLVRAVDKSINRIWRGGRRRTSMTVAIYWTLLTMGPLMLATLMWLTSRILALNIFGAELSFAQQALYYIIPVMIEWSMITVVFMVVPIAEVKLRDALTGAGLVTLLFEAAKRIFAAFILNFTDYQAIYGALAAVPVLMIWININWFIILLGAEFTALLGCVRRGGQEAPGLLSKFAALTGPVGEQEKSSPQPLSITVLVNGRPFCTAADGAEISRH